MNAERTGASRRSRAAVWSLQATECASALRQDVGRISAADPKLAAELCRIVESMTLHTCAAIDSGDPAALSRLAELETLAQGVRRLRQALT